MVREQDDLIAQILRYTQEEPATTEIRSHYEPQLRALASAVDAENPDNLTVVEVIDGYIVRYIVEGELHSRSFDQRALLAADETGRANRGSGTASPYGNLLRALGREWDRMTASNILIEEVAGTFIVTYLRPDPSAAVFIRKQYAMITPDVAERALGRARTRRAPEPPKRRLFGR